MIIPVRCFTCGLVVGSKYETYIKEMNRYVGYGLDYDPGQMNPELKNFNNEKIIIPSNAEDLMDYLFKKGMTITEDDIKYYDKSSQNSSWESEEEASKMQISPKKDIKIEINDTVEEISEDQTIVKIKGRWFRNQKVKNMQMRIFDKVGVTRYCCKRHLLTHIDLINIID